LFKKEKVSEDGSAYIMWKYENYCAGHIRWTCQGLTHSICPQSKEMFPVNSTM